MAPKLSDQLALNAASVPARHAQAEDRHRIDEQACIQRGFDSSESAKITNAAGALLSYPGRCDPSGLGGGCGGGHAARSLGVASRYADTSCDRSSGRGLPASPAASRKWASRDFGMPIVRQLCTVDTGASISRATAEVPPR